MASDAATYKGSQSVIYASGASSSAVLAASSATVASSALRRPQLLPARADASSLARVASSVASDAAVSLEAASSVASMAAAYNTNVSGTQAGSDADTNASGATTSTITASSTGVSVGETVTLTNSMSLGSYTYDLIGLGVANYNIKSATYTWYVSTDGENWSVANTSSSTSTTGSYSPDTSVAGTYYYQLVVSGDKKATWLVVNSKTSAFKAASNVVTIVVSDTNGNYTTQASSATSLADASASTAASMASATSSAYATLTATTDLSDDTSDSYRDRCFLLHDSNSVLCATSADCGLVPQTKQVVWSPLTKLKRIIPLHLLMHQVRLVYKRTQKATQF
ncbi:hypothetical protein L3X07_13150 [Levilactobacillus brevis]|nr:hypothetical protein [Levilactobacillus brevis]